MGSGRGRIGAAALGRSPGFLSRSTPMWRSFVIAFGLVAALSAAAPASAQDQTVSFNLGYFMLRGADSRVEGDVLNANRCIDSFTRCEPLLFEVDDFNNVTFGAEWLVGLGEFFEAGAGLGYYQRTVPTVYEFLTNADGSEIEQELKVRLVPLTASVRFFPTGRRAGVQPYIGAGVAFTRWQYSEVGSFVDTSTGEIFNARYPSDGPASGTDVGPLALGGVRFPVADQFLMGGELRYQWADTSLPADVGFVGDRLDLGGLTFQAVFQIRF
jgi:opacity protein-like surface antigen